MLNEFIAGGLAGMVSVVAGQPLDTIKVQFYASQHGNMLLSFLFP